MKKEIEVVEAIDILEKDLIEVIGILTSIVKNKQASSFKLRDISDSYDRLELGLVETRIETDLEYAERLEDEEFKRKKELEKEKRLETVKELEEKREEAKRKVEVLNRKIDLAKRGIDL